MDELVFLEHRQIMHFHERAIRILGRERMRQLTCTSESGTHFRQKFQQISKLNLDRENIMYNRNKPGPDSLKR
jgi:hypothetical protein